MRQRLMRTLMIQSYWLGMTRLLSKIPLAQNWLRMEIERRELDQLKSSSLWSLVSGEFLLQVGETKALLFICFPVLKRIHVAQVQAEKPRSTLKTFSNKN